MEIGFELEKCLRCGRCANVCPMGVIAMRDGAPAVVRAEKCMRCHHCYAACPAGAISIDGLVASDAPRPAERPAPEAVLGLLERRYSCREYNSKDPVDATSIQMLRRALETAPTGCNARATRYFILATPSETEAFRKALVERIEAAPAETAKANPMLRTMKIMLRRQADPIFRGAPHVVVSSFATGSPTGMTDSTIGLAHFEILAQAMGLGTCWCGFIPLIAKDVWPDILSYFGLDGSFHLGYAMLFGKKAFDYARPVSPFPLEP